MTQSLLALHNVLRWLILVLLIIAILQSFSKNRKIIKTSLWLMIAAHTTLIIGLYQWYFSETVGLKGLLERMGSFKYIMKDSFARFWAVEHITGMLIAIVLITIARSKSKLLNYNATKWLYIITLIIILAVIPWPFREAIGRPWLPSF